MIECIEKTEGGVVSLEHMKDHLRITHAMDDQYLQEIIVAATDAAERYIQRSLLLKTWRITKRTVPKEGMMNRIYLPWPPLVDLVSVREVSQQQHKDLRRYILTPNASIPYLTVWGQCVEVIYRAGYGTRIAHIPAPIRQAVTMIATEFYEKREGEGDMPMSAQTLLQSFRVMSCR